MIPKYLYSKEIVSLVDKSISCGYDSFDDLSSFDKAELTAKCIAYLGTDCHNAITDSDNFDSTVDCFIKFLLTGTKSEAYDLAESMRDNAVKYFSDNLEELFQERLEDRSIEMNIEAGLRPYKDATNGEIMWTR